MCLQNLFERFESENFIIGQKEPVEAVLNKVVERHFPKFADLFIRARGSFNHGNALKTSLPDSHITEQLNDFIFLTDGASKFFGCFSAALPDSESSMDLVDAIAGDIHAADPHALVGRRPDDIESRFLRLFQIYPNPQKRAAQQMHRLLLG